MDLPQFKAVANGERTAKYLHTNYQKQQATKRAINSITTTTAKKCKKYKILRAEEKHSAVANKTRFIFSHDLERGNFIRAATATNTTTTTTSNATMISAQQGD